MPRHLCFIEDVTPKSKPTWSVKIRVLEKHPAKGSLNSPKKHQKYIFGDEKGSRVQAVVWGTDINLFNRRLHPFKAYYISKAFVRSCSSKYQLINHPFEWVISGKTVIEDCNDPGDQLETVALNFTPFSEFSAYLNSPVHLAKTNVITLSCCLICFITYADIIAILFDIDLARKTNTKYGTSYVQEAVIINQELKPIMITFWDSHVENECINMYSQRAQNPVIVVFRAKVGSYNGMSLAAKNSSGVMTGPQIPAALQLRQWYDANKETIQAKFNPADYYSSASSLKEITDKNLKTLAEAMAVPENTILWTKVSVSVVNYLQQFYYMSCSNCTKSTGFDNGEIFWCIFCGDKAAIATPRCSIQVQLKDETGIAQGQLYGELAESITACKAANFMSIIEKDGSEALHQVLKIDDKMVYLVQIRAMKNEQNEGAPKKYSIYKAQKIEDLTEILGTGSMQQQNNSTASLEPKNSFVLRSNDVPPECSQESSTSKTAI